MDFLITSSSSDSNSDPSANLSSANSGTSTDDETANILSAIIGLYGRRNRIEDGMSISSANSLTNNDDSSAPSSISDLTEIVTGNSRALSDNESDDGSVISQVSTARSDPGYAFVEVASLMNTESNNSEIGTVDDNGGVIDNNDNIPENDFQIHSNSESLESQEIKPVRNNRKRVLDDSPPCKRVKSDSDEDEEEGRICPICFDFWTNSGDHRLCSLKCGHLFGHKCLTRWLKSQGQKTCPTCKSKASMKDIRFLFARKVIVTDTESIDKLNAELESVKADRNRLTFEVTRLQTVFRNQQVTIERQASQILQLQNNSIQKQVEKCEQLKQRQFHLEKTLDLSRDDGCRIMAYNFDDLIVVTLKSSNQLFSGFGIKKININNYQPTQFVPLHSKLIRDLAFHPQTGELLLSVSLDKTAKLTNIVTNSVINTFSTEMQLWSCCWDANDPNIFYVGSQRGTILQFNVQNPDEPIQTLSVPDDTSPVITLVSIEPSSGSYLPRGGLLCCKLSSCWMFVMNETSFVAKKVELEGPFVTLNYNKLSRKILISTRPNPRWVFCRHIVCELEENEATFKVAIIHSFQGGTTQTHLSRNCQMPINGDVYIPCYQETKRQINMWRVSTGDLHQTIAAPEPIIDMCYVSSKNNLVTLSEKRIRVYSANTTN